MAEYTVRWWQAGDREAFLDLYERILGGDYGAEWFSWKYEDDPYVDHVPIALAECGGDLVGARAFFALEMVVGGQRCLALQPCDTMVRADHRRNGLFTRMTELAIERYGPSSPAFFFNFPNDQSLPANHSLGWQAVTDLGVAYRIENPGRLAADRTDSSLARVAGRLATPVVTAYNRLQAGSRTDPSGASVRRTEGVPADSLASRYHASVPDGIHAVRDEGFYRWRFSNPNREYATYLAGDGATMVVGAPVASDVSLVEVVDVLPLATGEATDGKAALLDRIVADHPNADLFSVPSGAVPTSTMRGAGFHGDDRFPLSVLGRSRTQVARGLDGPDVHGVDVTDGDNWTYTFAELDSA